MIKKISTFIALLAACVILFIASLNYILFDKDISTFNAMLILGAWVYIHTNDEG